MDELLDFAGVALGLRVECPGAVGDVAEDLQGGVLLEARGRACAHAGETLRELHTVARRPDAFP